MARGKRRAGRGEDTQPAVVTSALGGGRGMSRTAERRRRKRQRRQRTTVAVALLAVLGVVALAVLVRGAVTKDEKDDAPKARTQRTLLLAVTNDNGSGRATALLAHDPAETNASVVLIPPRTLADVAGIGNVVLGNALRLGGPDVAREAVSDLMGVTVDHHWTLTNASFASLVDRVGGVVVDVDTDVVVSGPGDTTSIVVRAGAAQRLDGATALTYATYVARGQDEITFQSRLQRVLEALLTALPEDRAELATSLAALGGGATTSWQSDDLAGFLDGVRKARESDRYEPQVLPVTVIDTGGAPTFSIDVDAVATLVHTQLAESIPPGRDVGDNRVLILNGVGTPGIGGTVADRLRDEFRIVGTRNKQPFDTAKSVVVVYDTSDASQARARRVATLLGLPEDAVRIGTQTQSVADVIVVIGRDFRP